MPLLIQSDRLLIFISICMFSEVYKKCAVNMRVGGVSVSVFFMDSVTVADGITVGNLESDLRLRSVK